jgi:phospholipase C
MALGDIEHIFLVMLENRSFDHMLGYLSLDETSPRLPVDGLLSSKAWRDSHANIGDGKPFPVARLATKPKPKKLGDPPHNKAWIAAQLDGAPAGPGPTGMGGFVQAYIDSRVKHVDKHGKPDPRPKPKRPGDVMGYYDAELLPTFDFLARNYCVCDRWFASLPLGTQANRLMCMAGESTLVDNAGLSTFPDQSLVYSWLDGKVPWRVYTWGGFVPFFTLMKRYRGRIAKSMLTGEGEFRRYSRLARHWADKKPFPAVTFIEPEYSDGPGFRANDDHPPTGVAGGQALVAEIYNTLISNPERWAKTLMIVTYDEHGGFFDHVPPPALPDKAGGVDFATTGPRVPALLVSPHVGKGQVYSEPLDHTSFLQLLADRFTAGTPYSARVARRQKSLTGRIADALGPVRTETPKKMRAVETKSLEAAALLPARVQVRAPNTPNGLALDKAVRELLAENPRLAAHPDYGEMTSYVATIKAPTIEQPDYIP